MHEPAEMSGPATEAGIRAGTTEGNALTDITDGRRAKGERRRRELIEATLRVVAAHGVSGVSHRTVATEAGLPATAAAYHFNGIDELLTAALTQVMDDDADRMRRFAAVEASEGGDGIRAMAERMTSMVTEYGHLLAEYELYLLAARDERLRAPTDRWLDALADFARRYTADPARIDLLTGVVDGVLLQGLLRAEKPSADHYEKILRLALIENPTAVENSP